MKTRGNVAYIRVKHKNIICKKTAQHKKYFLFYFWKVQVQYQKNKKKYLILSVCVSQKKRLCVQFLKKKSEKKYKICIYTTTSRALLLLFVDFEWHKLSIIWEGYKRLSKNKTSYKLSTDQKIILTTPRLDALTSPSPAPPTLQTTLNCVNSSLIVVCKSLKIHDKLYVFSEKHF